MIADEDTFSSTNAVLSDAEGITLKSIMRCMERTIPFFKSALTQLKTITRKKNLNENQLTQVFVEQATMKISNSIGVLNQYSDVFFGTKGVPDFYFYMREEGKTHYSFFVVESKRLPAPDHKETREKEYVIGNKNNGGIKRYKTEKHGKNLTESGMLGFIEKETLAYWLEKINGWIADLARSSGTWNSDEISSCQTGNHIYCFLESVVHRISKKPDIKLSHWWITL